MERPPHARILERIALGIEVNFDVPRSMSLLEDQVVTQIGLQSISILIRYSRLQVGTRVELLGTERGQAGGRIEDGRPFDAIEVWLALDEVVRVLDHGAAD